MDVIGVIMAGGSGTRLWPLSRANLPKQLLNLSGRDVLINETIDRMKPSVVQDVLIVTGCGQAERLRQEIGSRTGEMNILTEPVARNTAACIGYAAVRLREQFGDAVMVVAPSDAYIRDEAEYARVLSVAVEYAKTHESLLTVGIMPTYAATGYGYMKYAEACGEVKPVLRFVEKPDEARAEAYLQEGGYVWNSGVFVWKVSTVLRSFERLLPALYRGLCEIEESIGTASEAEVLRRVYPTLESVSVDYGILEKETNIFVVPGNFGWCDVGSLDMLSVLNAADENGNVMLGDTVAVASKGNIVCSRTKRLVALADVNDMVIVDTDDVLLVCPKNKAQDVKKLVEALKRSGNEGVL